MAHASGDDSFLVTNLSPNDARAIVVALTPERPSRLGVHEDDLWLLVGPVAEQVPTSWSHPRAVPLLAAGA